MVKDFVAFDKYDPEAVEQALRWAQTAILNPSSDHSPVQAWHGRHLEAALLERR